MSLSKGIQIKIYFLTRGEMASEFLTPSKQTIVCISFYLELVQSQFYGQTGLECGTAEVKNSHAHRPTPTHLYDQSFAQPS